MRTFFVRLFVIVLWVILFFLLAHSHISTNETLSSQFKINFMKFAPQGWGFFTKNPNVGYLLTYEYSENGCSELLTINNSSVENWFGLSKNNRYLDIEVQKILTNVPLGTWKEDKGDPKCKKIDSFETLKVDLPIKRLTYGKKYIFATTKPMPLSWVGENQEKFKPYQYVALIIKRAESGTN